MCTDSAVASKDAAGAPEAEIEVTPLMVEAGVFALLRFTDSMLTSDVVVREVFLAMQSSMGDIRKV
jgi:hypothetical protein